MYLSNWKQKDFGEFQKKFSKIFNVYNAKKLSKIDIDKKKLKLVFYLQIFINLIQLLILLKILLKDLKQTKFETFGLSLLKINQHDETTDKF